MENTLRLSSSAFPSSSQDLSTGLVNLPLCRVRVPPLSVSPGSHGHRAACSRRQPLLLRLQATSHARNMSRFGSKVHLRVHDGQFWESRLQHGLTRKAVKPASSTSPYGRADSPCTVVCKASPGGESALPSIKKSFPEAPSEPRVESAGFESNSQSRLTKEQGRAAASNGVPAGAEVVLESISTDKSSWERQQQPSGKQSKPTLLRKFSEKPHLALLALLLPGITLAALHVASFLRSQPKGYRAAIQFPDACGVSVGTPVRIRGIEVGTVVQMNPSLEGVNAIFEVRDETTVIPKAAAFIANRSGLVAEPLVDITPLEDGLGPLSHGPKDKDACRREGKIICEGDAVQGNAGVSMDELVGLWIKMGRASDVERAKRMPKV